MNSITKAYYIARYLGPRFVTARLKILFDKKTGRTARVFWPREWMRIDDDLRIDRQSDQEYAQFKLNQGIPFFFPAGSPPPIAELARAAPGLRSPSLAERIELLKANRLTYFLERPSPNALDWYENPFDGRRGISDKPWHEISDFTPEQGDARTLWESSRAAWAIDLARAFSRLPQAQREGKAGEELAGLYWNLVHSWMNACPPWQGFQWKCGQEASIRFLAIALGFGAFARSSTSSAARWKQLARLAWATGYRVFHHINYAISQNNNHALSEACGLMLVAHLFPEFRESALWESKGRDVFEKQLPGQIYRDGSYIQHSMNYHRVMLHLSLVAFRLAELAGRPFARPLYELLGKASDFLLAMIDPVTGEVPRYGNNDGSCVLPLNECKFWDFRPVVAATHFLVRRERLFEPGPWDEDLQWIFEEDQAKSDSPSRSLGPLSRKLRSMERFDEGGYYVLRRGGSQAMIRCHTYRDRPGQCDPLHVDLWWKGINVLRDCGTYQYYVPGRPELEDYFSSLKAHNTVEVDGAQPFERASRFLRFPWPRAKLLEFESSLSRFWGVRHCYARGPWNVTLRRTVQATSDQEWIITDEALGAGEHTVTLRWHLFDGSVALDSVGRRLELTTPQGKVCLSVETNRGAISSFEVVRGKDLPGEIQGWVAEQYSRKSPAPTLEAVVRGELPVKIVSTVTLEGA